MKLLSALFASAVLAVSAGVAAADTVHLASYGYNATGTTVTGPSDAGNSVLVYFGSTTLSGTNFVAATSGKTYNLDSGLSPWAAPLGDSHWVAQNPKDSVGGGNVEPNAAYVFYTTFADVNPLASFGSIEVMADDTTAVYLNGNLIAAPASMDTAGTCASGTPTRTTPMTYFLPTQDFVSGTNVLSFAVLQEHGSATGVDFVGSVNVTPEPGSLLLLGTGLAMMAGFTYYRRVQA